MKTDPVIALSGPRCCGKSTIAEHLVNQHGYTSLAFADALRQIASVGGQEFANDRMYLARLGEKLRQLMPEFMLEVVRNRLETIDGPVVIEDVRFPSEVAFARDVGATLIRLEIPVEEQLNRLAQRDGTTGQDAEELIECMDELALVDVIDWNHVIDAVGDFKELATTLHELAEKPLYELKNHSSTMDRQHSQEVFL